MTPFDNPEVVKTAPGVVGSLVSMLFIKEPIVRRLAMFLAGAALARFGTPWLARLSGLDEGFAGFMLGLFGMAVIAKMFQAWETFELSLILRDWMRKVLGLPAREV